MRASTDLTRAGLVARWRAVRNTLAEVGGLVDGAKLVDRLLVDLEAVCAAEDGETLTLAQAAAESGYSRDHLARLIRTGAILNVGRRRAPRVRRVDLPRKPAARRRGVASRSVRAYDPGADARSLLARRGG